MGCKCCDGGKVECPDCNGGRVEVVVGDRGYDADCRRCEGRGWLWCDGCEGADRATEGDDALDAVQVQHELADREREFAEQAVNALAALFENESQVAA